MTNVTALEKSPRTVTIQFVKFAEKTHSVRYKASSEDPAVTDAYVMKKDLPKPYPQSFKMQLTFE